MLFIGDLSFLILNSLIPITSKSIFVLLWGIQVLHYFKGKNKYQYEKDYTELERRNKKK